jgi:uncharacterized protein YqhQ
MLSSNAPVYGGQAVLEGVMIRGQRNACVAVRRPDGTIALHTDPINPIFSGRLRKAPLVRGVIVLAETMTLGMRALTYSANVGMEAEGQEMSRGAVAATMAFSVLFAIGLFFVIPVFASRGLEGVVRSDILANLAEGLIRLGIFLAYVYLIGRMEQIRRVFMYHGAEHMTVHAQERLEPLEVEAVRRYSTAHPRCGTAFLLVVMVVAIVVFTFVGRDPLWWLIASRVVLVPFIAAVSYEAIRFSGFHADNPMVRIITAPSLALQALTTRQPDDDQIEVAIAAMNHAVAADGVAPGAKTGTQDGDGIGAGEPDVSGST